MLLNNLSDANNLYILQKGTGANNFRLSRNITTEYSWQTAQNIHIRIEKY